MSRFCGRHYWPLFRKLACELAEVTSEAHLKPGAFTWLLTAGNLTVLEERFLANCLLHDFEIFLAAAVLTGITLVVQCYNSKSNHRAGISLHRSPASGPAVEKRTMFVLTHSANLNPRGIYVVCFDHFKDKFFPRAVHIARSQRSITPLSIPTLCKKEPEKTLSARTRRKVPNLITQLK